jgi:BirA family biotin operon repressor/biotin-[acetyl-CoA-carboxylase] ligase
MWHTIDVLTSIPSTNAEVLRRATRGAEAGLVVVAESQTAGRGRLERTWVSPARAGLTFSVLLRPDPVPESRWAWLSLLTGVAVVEALEEVAEVEAALKWPNDVLIAGRKAAGILAERSGDVVVVGIGLNVTTRDAELPGTDATSLALSGAEMTDRETILRACLRTLGTRYTDWQAAAGAATELRPAYESRCSTLGQEVRVSLPDGRALTGTATGVDDDGRLVVTNNGVDTPLASGDVVHVRPRV